MIFRKKSEEPRPTYTFQVLPDNIPDGEHEFDGIKIGFSKPGWTWVVHEHNEGRWPRIHSIGNGFYTRDEALVDLLREARDLNEANRGSE